MRARAFSSCQLETAVRRAAWSWLVKQVTAFARTWAAELTARQAVRDLAAKNDRDLWDLGIFRSDIPRVVR
jgi:uncharacterized protein YjiS (DUF1127 family)